MSEFFRIDALGVEKYWEKYYWAGFSDSEGRGFHSSEWRYYFQNDAWQRMTRANHFDWAQIKIECLAPLSESMSGQLIDHLRAYNAMYRRYT